MRPTSTAEGQERSFHTEDVLIKTEQGHRESRMQTSQSSLPRRLRTLLLSVDGTSPFRVYAKTLENYGDVAAMFNQLRQEGYVQLLEEARTQTQVDRLEGFRKRLASLGLKNAG